MDPTEIQTALSRIIPEAFKFLTENGLQKHCIQSGALMTKILHRVGISDAYPLTVGVRIINPALRDYTTAHGEPTNDAALKASHDAGAAEVALGKDAGEVPEGNWPGHLVVVVPKAFGDKHAVVDLTIAQADVPEWGIRLRPVCAKVESDFVAGIGAASVVINGCELIYKAYPKDHSYNDGGNCMTLKGIDNAVSAVVRRLGY